MSKKRNRKKQNECRCEKLNFATAVLNFTIAVINLIAMVKISGSLFNRTFVSS